MSLLEVHRLDKTYSRQQRAAVNDVTFTVESGEFLSLVGESGSGKTTLLRLIAGLEHLDSGRIILQGRELASAKVHLAPEKRGIGLVFQHHALFPHLTVAQNVAFGLHGQSQKEKKLAVEEMLALVGLPNYDKRYAHELSGGERQRIALARSLATKPSVLLLDEPFSSLDPLLRESLRDETRRVLSTCGTTAILVTHHTRDALAISDRIAVMHHGVLQQIGAPIEVYHQPVNAYVASLFGPCNELELSGVDKVWVRPNELELVSVEHQAEGWSGVVRQVTYGGSCQDVTLECLTATGDAIELKVCHQGHWTVHEGETWGVIKKKKSS